MKRHRVPEIVTILQQIGRSIAQGCPVTEAANSAGITAITYYRWKNRYEGLSDSQAARVAQLETEIARLQKIVADLTLDKLILAEASRETLQSSVLRRAWVDRVKAMLNVSERRACRVLGQHRSTQRKTPKSPKMLFKMAILAAQPPAAALHDGSAEAPLPIPLSAAE